MAYQQKDNSGSLFINDKREKDTHPNAKGKAMVAGVMYWVSAWTRTDKRGQRWQSLAFTPMETSPPEDRGRFPDAPKPRTADQPNPISNEQHFTTEDIPF